MKLCIVTGGIGTGKSHVCRMLVEFGKGWCGFSSDESVARAYQDPEVQARVNEAFGLEICTAGLTSDQRSILRRRITASPEERAQLESILHPWVFQDLRRLHVECESAGSKVLVAEVPLYYETGAAVSADCILVVAASKASQIERLQTGRGLSEPVIKGMLGIQMPIESKMARADVVIWNDGSLGALERQVRLLAGQLSSDKTFQNERQ